MFISASFTSVNSARDLRLGTYGSVCKMYRGRGHLEAAFLFEYRADDDGLLAACDLLVVEGDGSMRARDFVKMSGQEWRDSVGLKAESLEALLPPELGEYVLREERRLSSERVGS